MGMNISWDIMIETGYVMYNIYIYMFPCWEIPHEMEQSMYSNRWSGWIIISQQPDIKFMFFDGSLY